MEHMQQPMGYPVFWTNQAQRPPVLTHTSMYPPLPPFPDFRKKRRKDGTCVYLFILFLLVLLALAGVGISTYKIMDLQKRLDQANEKSGDAMQNSYTEKLTGEPLEKRKQAAHVTGKESLDLPLAWEDSKGRAFTNGIQYRNRGLVVNQTGLHFLYSSIYFRHTDCPNDPLELTHVVYKKPSRYPSVMKLMESTEQHSCKSQNTWARHSYLAAVFNLTRDDVLYVNVSNVKLVSTNEAKSFFGLFKL